MRKNRNNNLYDLLIKNFCSKCIFYSEDFGVCGAEILPIQRAIQNNLEGRGLCHEIKDFVTKIEEVLKEQKRSEIWRD